MGKKIESRLIKLGSNPEIHHGSLSDPIYKTSTIIFDDYKSFIKAKKNKFKLPTTVDLVIILQKDLRKLLQKFMKVKRLLQQVQVYQP